jgi:hypothetical protein
VHNQVDQVDQALSVIQFLTPLAHLRLLLLLLLLLLNVCMVVICSPVRTPLTHLARSNYAAQAGRCSSYSNTTTGTVPAFGNGGSERCCEHCSGLVDQCVCVGVVLLVVA